MAVQLLQGDCREVLRGLPDDSVHCVVTSPPYWGLRDYGVDRQLGMEETPLEYVQAVVDVFREVWRVLRPDGTVWLNLGDTYATRPYGDRHTFDPKYNGRARAAGYPNRSGGHGLKHKDLVGIPWRVAFALQDDGWWLRNDNIWAKRNCMPESVRDRTTRAHEYMFHLTKSGAPTFWTHRDLPGVRSKPTTPDYRWVHRETRAETDVEPRADRAKDWRRINLWEAQDVYYDAVAIEEEGEYPAGTRAAKGSAERAKHANGRPPEYAVYTGKRNKRSVWFIATQPFPEAHFATFPPDLIQPCILAGTSERGCCPGCGAPWTRQTGDRADVEGRSSGNKERTPGGDRIAGASHVGRGFPWQASVATTRGWSPSCSCQPHDPVPCTVLDPFGGAGTTGLVADRIGRDAILIELNPEYVAMAETRLRSDAPLFVNVAAQ